MAQQSKRTPRHKTFDGLLRDLAISMVDGKHGFTMEFAPSPDAHREEYDRMERDLRISLEVLQASLVHNSRLRTDLAKAKAED